MKETYLEPTIVKVRFMKNQSKKEKFEDTKGVMRNSQSIDKDQYHVQRKKDKNNNQWSIKHYTEN